MGGQLYPSPYMEAFIPLPNKDQHVTSPLGPDEDVTPPHHRGSGADIIPPRTI